MRRGEARTLGGTTMRIRHAAVLIAICVVAACDQKATAQWQLADAIPASAPGNCVSPNARERSLLELAVSAIEQSGGDNPSWLDIGAQRYLARHQFRIEGGHGVAICTPDEVLKRVAAAFEARKGLGKGRLVEYQLELAARLPARSRYVVEAVGKSAFNLQVQESDVFKQKDIRPYARTVLASFGHDADAFKALAYEQMSMEDSMGTGAAQVAAATGHPDALPKIERMIEDALADVPVDKVVPRAKRDRLYELAWAIYFAGDAGKAHTKPIHAMMNRKVQSWAPPFGMVELRPKRLCGVLARIEGAESIKPYAFCFDEKVPLEQ
jgi:hypothetical protein